MNKVYFYTVEDDQGHTIADEESHEEVLKAAGEYFENYAYDHIFPEGYSNGDEYEFEATLVHWDEDNNDITEYFTSFVVGYYHGDWEEHNTMYKGGSL